MGYRWICVNAFCLHGSYPPSSPPKRNSQGDWNMLFIMFLSFHVQNLWAFVKKRKDLWLLIKQSTSVKKKISVHIILFPIFYVPISLMFEVKSQSNFYTFFFSFFSRCWALKLKCQTIICWDLAFRLTNWQRWRNLMNIWAIHAEIKTILQQEIRHSEGKCPTADDSWSTICEGDRKIPDQEVHRKIPDQEVYRKIPDQEVQRKIPDQEVYILRENVWQLTTLYELHMKKRKKNPRARGRPSDGKCQTTDWNWPWTVMRNLMPRDYHSLSLHWFYWLNSDWWLIIKV